MFGAARGAGAVVGGVDVEAAVRLAERPHVGPHPLFEEELVEADEVAVAAAGGDLRQRDHLVPFLVGADVDHRPRPRGLPAPDRVGEVAAPGTKGLDHRRVLVHSLGEVPEIGHVAGVGDAEVDLLGGWLQQGEGRRGSREEHQRERAGESNRKCGAELSQAGHRSPMLARPGPWVDSSLGACNPGCDKWRVNCAIGRLTLHSWLASGQAASGAACSAISASTSGAYFSMKAGPTPLIASRAPSSCGRAAAIALRVLLAATV